MLAVSLLRHPSATPIAFALASLMIGFVVLGFTVDVPADGPYRAMMAYEWLRKPYLAKCGTWLPAPVYLNGLFLNIVGDPFVSVRVFNVLVGAATMPIYYLLLRRVFDAPIALIGAVALLALPLRIGLSASSLTETAFIFELLAGIWLLIRATDSTPVRLTVLGVALGLLILAMMTRYEAWLLIPAFPAYLYIRTRRPALALAFAAALLLFPLAWSAGNQYCFGDALKGFRSATSEERYAEAVGLLDAAGILAQRLVQQTGLVASSSLAVGGMLVLLQVFRWRELTIERMLYLGLMAFVWAVLLRFTMARGAGSFQARYLLLALTLALPLLAMPFRTWIGRRAVVAALAALFAVSELAAGHAITQAWFPDLWLVRKRPGDAVDDMKSLAEWIGASPYRGQALLSTPLKNDDGWATNYLPLFLPDVIGRVRTLSYWLSDADVTAFVESERPALLITGDSDIDREEFQRATRLLGGRLAGRPEWVRASGVPVRVYRVNPD
ncbi:MAG: glycosyltransferase family 39 protein [Methylotetracoccus sp.]